MVALWWIKHHGDWSVFVSNRVREINQFSSPQAWRHVPGNLNPADLLSRGCSPRKFYESRWWLGPGWLKESEEKWPSDEILFQSSDVDIERKRVRLCGLNLLDETPWYCVRFSGYNSIVRLMAWVLRFVNNAKKGGIRKVGELSVEEIDYAEKVLWRIEQALCFPDPRAVPVINTFRDDDGIIRVKTRITERIDQPYFISPILLPDKRVLTRRLIEHLHITSCHAGTQILLSILREKFWIVRGRRTVRGVLRQCVRCQRFRSKPLVSDPVSLPANRVKDAHVFEIVGVDLAGPLYIKHKDKCWVVLFTCAVYRAIHLELVTSLSTEVFLMSLKRFISRRGRPRIIYSDNGTNFQGSFNEMNRLDWEKITRETSMQRITWLFNPPTGSWWGGWWERLIRVLKDLLKRTLGKAVLTYEELFTVLCDCESVVNSRPLTYLSEDTDDLVPLTPAMFLLDNANLSAVDVDEIEARHCRMRVKYRARVMEDLRRRFRREYLSQLIQKKESNKNAFSVKRGDVVIIGDDLRKRIDWPLGRVEELIPGKDGVVRVVKVKTSSGLLTRPIQRLYLLELPPEELSDFLRERSKGMSSDDLSNDPDPPSVPTVTRAGRVVRPPERLVLNCLESSSRDAGKDDAERLDFEWPSGNSKGGGCCVKKKKNILC